MQARQGPLQPAQGAGLYSGRGEDRYGEQEFESGGLGYGHSESGASSVGPAGQQRGFGRGGFAHSRHRGELFELGRSSVYGQPPGESGPYPGRPVERETVGEMSHQRVGPKGYTRSDERIQEFICERLAQYHWLDVEDVSVAVAQGEVRLEGTVPDRRMRYEIEDVAARCWGVRDVDNRLRVVTQAASDTVEPGQWPGSARPASARARSGQGPR